MENKNVVSVGLVLTIVALATSRNITQAEKSWIMKTMSQYEGVVPEVKNLIEGTYNLTKTEKKMVKKLINRDNVLPTVKRIIRAVYKDPLYIVEYLSKHNQWCRALIKPLRSLSVSSNGRPRYRVRGACDDGDEDYESEQSSDSQSEEESWEQIPENIAKRRIKIEEEDLLITNILHWENGPKYGSDLKGWCWDISAGRVFKLSFRTPEDTVCRVNMILYDDGDGRRNFRC